MVRPATTKRLAGADTTPTTAPAAAQDPTKDQAPSTAPSTSRRPEAPAAPSTTTAATPQTHFLPAIPTAPEARKARPARTRRNGAILPSCSEPPSAAKGGRAPLKTPTAFTTRAGESEERVAVTPRAEKEPTARSQTERTVRRPAAEAGSYSTAAPAQPSSALPEPAADTSTEKTSAS